MPTNFQQEMAWAGVKVLRDDFVQWRMCQRKRRHSTEQAALAALQRTRTEDENPLNVYYCEHCYGWHVGHVPGGVKK